MGINHIQPNNIPKTTSPVIYKSTNKSSALGGFLGGLIGFPLLSIIILGVIILSYISTILKESNQVTRNVNETADNIAQDSINVTNNIVGNTSQVLNQVTASLITLSGELQNTIAIATPAMEHMAEATDGLNSAIENLQLPPDIIDQLQTILPTNIVELIENAVEQGGSSIGEGLSEGLAPIGDSLNELVVLLRDISTCNDDDDDECLQQMNQITSKISVIQRDYQNLEHSMGSMDSTGSTGSIITSMIGDLPTDIKDSITTLLSNIDIEVIFNNIIDGTISSDTSANLPIIEQESLNLYNHLIQLQNCGDNAEGTNQDNDQGNDDCANITQAIVTSIRNIQTIQTNNLHEDYINYIPDIFNEWLSGRPDINYNSSNSLLPGF